MKEDLRIINRKCKFLYIMKFLVSCLLRGSVLIIPIFYSYAIEYITIGNLHKAILLGIFLLVFTIVYYLLEMLNDYAYEKLYYRLYVRLTKLNLQNTENNSMHSLSRIPIGQFYCIMTGDVNVVSDCYASIPMALARVIELSIIFYYFFSVNLLVGIISLAVSAIVLVALYFGNEKVNEINDQDKTTHDQRLGVLQEYFLGMKEVKGFRLFTAMNNRINKSYETYLNWHTKYGFYKVVVKYGSLAIVDISKVLFLFYGFYLATNNQMPLAIIILIYSYFEKLISSFTGLLNFNNQLQNSKVALKRIFKLKEYTNTNRQLENANIIGKGYIDFNDIVYGDKKEPTLNNFTAHINSQGITVITGVTGSGKTGIVDLLLKLNRQHEGTIKIDKIDINEYSDDIYFGSVAAVRQNPNFFNISIRDNLEIIEPDFEKIVSVCEDIGVHDDIMQLPNGYDTIISESASNVPNNIKYLLSIARVILKKPKILIFDETLNAFPKDIDMQLMDYFRKTKGRHNVIIISKEKHVIEEADQVIFMKKGTALASGKHETIIIKNDEYKKYFEEL